MWAIGTGKTATSAQAQDAHAHVRAVLEQLSDKTTASKVRIQYGGSVKPANAKDFSTSLTSTAPWSAGRVSKSVASRKSSRRVSRCSPCQLRPNRRPIYSGGVLNAGRRDTAAKERRPRTTESRKNSTRSRIRFIESLKGVQRLLQSLVEAAARQPNLNRAIFSWMRRSAARLRASREDRPVATGSSRRPERGEQVR